MGKNRMQSQNQSLGKHLKVHLLNKGQRSIDPLQTTGYDTPRSLGLIPISQSGRSGRPSDLRYGSMSSGNKRGW